MAKRKDSSTSKKFGPCNSNQETFKFEETNSELKENFIEIENIYLVTFKKVDKELYNEYLENFLASNLNLPRILLVSFAILCFILFIKMLVSENEMPLGFQIMRILIRVNVVVSCLLLSKYFQKLTDQTRKIFLLFLFCSVNVFLLSNFLFYESRLYYFIEIIIELNIILTLNSINFKESLIASCVFFIYFAFLLIGFRKGSNEWIIYLFCLASNVMNLINLRKRKLNSVKEFNTIKKNLFHKTQQQRLIMYLLPAHVNLH